MSRRQAGSRDGISGAPAAAGQDGQGGAHQPASASEEAAQLDPGLPTFGAADFHLLAEGTHAKLYERLGAHVVGDAAARGGVKDAQAGTRFAVWAPNAESVDVVGDWTDWRPGQAPLRPLGATGVWAGFVANIGVGRHYKFHIRSRHGGYEVDKADPFAFATEHPPATASVIASLDYTWNDAAWMQQRRARNALNAPQSIYEVHLGSWMRDPAHPDRPFRFRDLAPRLVEHVRRTGFTHVELMPVMEHPFYGSWGYQVTSFFAPSARDGGPQDFMAFIEILHQNDIGVILDWTPAHFPEDEHGLVYFDGTHVYEHADPRQGHHPEWGSAVFNYARNEVRSFLISNAIFWLDRYHIDGLRVDAVASMLYLDYGRKDDDWVRNEHGGNENLAAIDFLRTFNQAVYRQHPDVQTIAEESTSWPMVSRPTYVGGLGFGLKWDMGWMHDTLAYFSVDPLHRRYHHHTLTFRGVYAFSENFVLPLSHDEVVYGKRSLLEKMPGDRWQKFANLRALYAHMWAHPGKKLLFMGGELAQEQEWSHDRSLDWHLLERADHGGVQALVRDLNRIYRDEPALWEADAEPAGFRWLEAGDASWNVLVFARFSADGARAVICAGNFSPVPRQRYRVGLPRGGRWREVLNTDATRYGGSNVVNGAVEAEETPWHDQPFSAEVTLPPLGVIWLVPDACADHLHRRGPGPLTMWCDTFVRQL